MGKPRDSSPPGSTRKQPAENGKGLSRRDFMKVAGAAVPASVIMGEGILPMDVVAASPVFGPDVVQVVLRVNGRDRALQVEPRVTLLDALRDYLDFTGAKKVCDRGACGACTVLLDGEAVYACSILAVEVQGKEITTIEGIAPEGELHPLSSAFVEHDAQQCGFCTPGFVMASKALIDQRPFLSEEDVQKHLGGNLCRCGTYMGIRKAVVEAAQRMGGRS